jgi:hypothetical protein
MANKTIKGLTVEIGGDTTKLGKALDNVNKQSQNLSGELNRINKLLKMDPGNADLLAQKQQVLANAVSDTSKKLEILQDAEKQVQEQFRRGEVSEAQVRELQREIIATTQELKKLEREAEETSDAIWRLGDESDDAGKEIDDVADSADEAEKESEELGSTLDGTLSKGFTAVAAVAAAASAAIVGCVEASHEYRTAMGKLETSFASSDHSAEAAKTTYKELQSILGETDQAVEAASHLAKIASTEAELEELTHALTGVYAVFGDSLPIEGLAEAANETVKVGKVTGSFADAINWAADANTDWKKILGTNTKAMSAFEKAIEEGEATEDAYTAALDACTDEQERQQLITKTLTKLYGKAGTQYKKTNKNVIESNKANEEWNATLADLGDEMTPVVTSIKRFGTELLKNAEGPLEAVADLLVDTVLPALSKLIKWVSNNIPTIKAGLVGITAALVAYKVATIAAEVSQKGLKGAILATEIAQKALTIAMNATPWGLIATAVVGVVAAVVAFKDSSREAAIAVDVLTEEEKKLLEEANKTAGAFREQKTETDKTVGSIQSQMGHVQRLADELRILADASGKVQEKDEARVNFILGELKKALGEEYTLTDGVIQNYDKLKESIDQVILSKTVNSMLEAKNADYVAALDAESTALAAVNTSYKDWQDYQNATRESRQKYFDDWIYYQEKVAEYWNIPLLVDYYQAERDEAYQSYMSLVQNVNDKEKAYNDALANYGMYHNTVLEYEEAQAAALSGNTDRALELLKTKGDSYAEYSGEIDEATRKAIDALYKEAIDAGLAAERIRENFENGVEGYTHGMVIEAEKGYEAALNAYADAYIDATAVGNDLGTGLGQGMEEKRSSLKEKAKSLVNSILTSMKKAADSNSPSKKTMAFGEDLGEGTDIGLESKTKDLMGTARKQVSRLLDAYQDEGEDAGPQAIRSVSAQAATKSNQFLQGFANSSGSKLDKILAAIERGQVLVLDGDAVVGGTADRMNRKLGQDRELVARGAK